MAAAAARMTNRRYWATTTTTLFTALLLLPTWLTRSEDIPYEPRRLTGGLGLIESCRDRGSSTLTGLRSWRLANGPKRREDGKVCSRTMTTCGLNTVWLPSVGDMTVVIRARRPGFRHLWRKVSCRGIAMLTSANRRFRYSKRFPVNQDPPLARRAVCHPVPPPGRRRARRRLAWSPTVTVGAQDERARCRCLPLW